MWWVYPELKDLAQEVLASGVHPLTLAKHTGIRKDTAYAWKRALNKPDFRAEMQTDPEMVRKRGEFIKGLMAARCEHENNPVQIPKFNDK